MTMCIDTRQQQKEIYRYVICNINNLRLYNPKDIYKNLIQNQNIKKWYDFISNHYLPPKDKRILLLYPCSKKKPYRNSRTYKILFKTLEKLGDKKNEIHLVTLSEPYALVPEEFYGIIDHYDCPGLFKWWCKAHGEKYSKEYVDKSIDILSNVIAKFLDRTRSHYARRIAFVRTYSSSLRVKDSHTHRRMIEIASKIVNVNVEILPPKEVVYKIVEKHGRFVWDVYGVSHPIAQGFLLDYLRQL